MAKKGELWPEYGKCHLCQAVGKLSRSHIIPKFVGVWMRETNVLGRLRSNDVPSKLVEDLPWRYMLCAAREDRFNRFETEACERLFLPVHDNQREHLRYASGCYSISRAGWRRNIPAPPRACGRDSTKRSPSSR